MAAAAAGAARSAARAVANDVSASVSNGAAAPADSAAAELGALRSRVAELEGDRQRLLDAPPTIESLATSIEMLVAGQAQLVAGQSKVEEMMLQSMGKDASGHRAAPTESLELASTIKAMEEHGLTTFQVDQAHTMFELYDLDGSGCLDPAELLEILRALGTHPTKERVAELIREEDRSENGTVTLNEFFHVYEKLAVPLDGVTVDGVHDTQGLNLKAISDYGIYAMMRWVHHDDDEINGDVTGPLVPVFRRKCRSFVLRRDAEYIFYIAIWLSAVSSGLNTYDEFVQLTWVEGLADVTMIIFAFEVFVKFMCETQSCGAVLGFFGNFWNGFDFFLLVSIGVMTPLLKDQDGPTALRCLRILRLVRSLRILRAAKILPKLMLVLETLIASITSVGYIVLFMLLTSYIFAIVAVTLFGKNDPFHFGDLGSAMLSLFRIATQEDWTDIMYFNMYGCDGWGDYSGAVAVGSDDCVPESFFFASPAFFVLYITMTTFLLLNLFIGVIVNNMMETKAAAEQKKEEAKAWAVATRLKMHTGPKFLGHGSDLAKGMAGGMGGMVKEGSRFGTKMFSKKGAKKGRTEGEVEFGQEVGDQFENPVGETVDSVDGDPTTPSTIVGDSPVS